MHKLNKTMILISQSNFKFNFKPLGTFHYRLHEGMHRQAVWLMFTCSTWRLEEFCLEHERYKRNCAEQTVPHIVSITAIKKYAPTCPLHKITIWFLFLTFLVTKPRLKSCKLTYTNGPELNMSHVVVRPTLCPKRNTAWWLKFILSYLWGISKHAKDEDKNKNVITFRPY